MNQKTKLTAGRALLLAGASGMIMAAAATAYAQDQNDVDPNVTGETTAAPQTANQPGDDVIVVTGVRASLQNAMDTKRNANGVVDAISAEDIGDFPDTNLAESLQRITGVSIDRQNGEGSGITVRGFGPGYNLITLNGRTLPTAEVGVIGARGNFPPGASRTFDFSNLASEGVSGLTVYKTGQAIIPSGGIGATVDIATVKPLDGSGRTLTLQAKALHDSSVEDGSDITPEISGIGSWTDPSERFGISLYGSYSKRDSGAPTQQVNDWLVFDPREREDGSAPDPAFLDNGSYVTADTTVTNPPAADQLYGIPQDSRYDFSDIERERINGQVVLQFRPMENLTLTGDYLYVQNKSSELRYEQTNWFATPMDEFIFDTSGPVATPLYIYEFNGGTKDIGFEQTNRATKDELGSFGFNAEWEATDSLTVVLDAHSSEAKSGGDNPNGHVADFFSMGAPVILEHSADHSSGYPIQQYSIDDTEKGNGNGVLDVGDLASQVQRSTSAEMQTQLDEIDLRAVFETGDGSLLTIGTNYRDTKMLRGNLNTQQDLGSWGLANPGDVQEIAPGLIDTYCLECLFDDIPVGQADIAFKADASELFPIFQQAYSENLVAVTPSLDRVQEKIWAAYAQFSTEMEFFGRDARFNAGIRYEDTKVDSSAAQATPTTVLWQSDNDFQILSGGEGSDVSGTGSYTNLLPNADFQVDVTDNVLARASYSKTISRVPYSNLFASVNVGAPNRPTALGGTTASNTQDPTLEPLESDNYDASIEWYYGDTSYISAGYFYKNVRNFLGNAVVNGPLFGLRDPASGADGTRSGDALGIINDLGIEQSEANLFSIVALIDANGGDVAAGRAAFEGYLAGGITQAEYDEILGAYDVVPNGDDPLLNFAINRPVNDFDGVIHGWELAWQHFFGDSGFGFAANYTIVDGNTDADPAASTTVNQFALVGLSDTANFTAIYENYGVSARLAYNWRDTFLSETNSGGDRSPIYVEDYGQLDLNVSYDLTDNLALSFEAINLTGEDQRTYHRVPEQFYFGYELSPRYYFGARYSF
ncbi:TonB-dependent receptor [Parvularcula dongshanensis]|uniref:TonB-dependent receptor n=1 Tax=Parvularcula dongshanensis TaxID=1173995 RepID=A0A840I620_9PROT|nr:TonB-dependent receptor [Parvularcula dongshanensis]